MIPFTTIICQEGGHKVALEYASLVKSIGIPVLVNFPNTKGFDVATSPAQLINDSNSAIITIISGDIFPGSKHTSKFRIDPDVMRFLVDRSRSNRTTRIFIVLTDNSVETLIRGKWISRYQYLVDTPIIREQILDQLSRLTPLDESEDTLQPLDDINTVIQSLEPGCNVSEIANERVPKERIFYQIFECAHKVRNRAMYYVHLHRGATLINVAKHMEDNYPHVFQDTNKCVLFPIEPGTVRPQDRPENVRNVLRCKDAEYLEEAVSHLISEQIRSMHAIEVDNRTRDFIEPNVQFDERNPTIAEQPYSAIMEWLANRNSGVLVLVGQGGIGKTWVMQNLRYRITELKVAFRKAIDRFVVFVSSTDIQRGIGATHPRQSELTIYDLYVASCISMFGDDNTHIIDKKTFYNALLLGNILVFIDGLDEVIARNRARFNVAQFFADINYNLGPGSEARIIISCRNIFFDDDQYSIDYPHINVVRLLAFDERKRDEFFGDAFGNYPTRLKKAVTLSNRLARLPDKRYVPFVLSLIKDVVTEEIDGTSVRAQRFSSDILDENDYFDRVVGQFCHREMIKILDHRAGLTVDDQVRTFCEVARIQEGNQLLVSRSKFRSMLSGILGRRDVDTLASHLETHPFLSQEELKKRDILAFRFDFMPEYFAMVHISTKLNEGMDIDDTDLGLVNKFGGLRSVFSQGIARRWRRDESEFRFAILSMLERGREIISSSQSEADGSFSAIDSQSALLSFSCLSLLYNYYYYVDNKSISDIGDIILDFFTTDKKVVEMFVLDGILDNDRKLRFDFRGRVVENCFFNEMDFFGCQFDYETSFKRCKFTNCSGAFMRASDIRSVSFSTDCQFDDEFEKVLSAANRKVSSTSAQIAESIRSFISDFHKGFGFRRVSLDNIERYYGMSNSAVPFKTMIAAMRRKGVISEQDKGAYLDLWISKDCMAAAERLISQGVLAGKLEDVAIELNEKA